MLPQRPRGFALPSIWLLRLVSDQLAMSFRRRLQPNVDVVKLIWDEVVRQVKEQGLMLSMAAAWNVTPAAKWAEGTSVLQ